MAWPALLCAAVVSLGAGCGTDARTPLTDDSEVEVEVEAEVEVEVESEVEVEAEVESEVESETVLDTASDTETQGPTLADVHFAVTPPAGYSGPLYVERVMFERIGGGIFVGARSELTRQVDGTYAATLHAPLGDVLRYRYARDAFLPIAAEARFGAGTIMVREAVVDAMNVDLVDTVHMWADDAPVMPTLHPVTIHVESGGAPIVDAAVSGPGGAFQNSAGYSTVAMDRTDIDGNVTVHVPEGETRFVASYDGSRFAQGTIDVPAETTITITLPAESTRLVHFDMTLPAEVPEWAVPRLYGTVPALGFGYRQGYLQALRGASLRHVSGRLWGVDVELPDGGIELFVSLGDDFYGHEVTATGTEARFGIVVGTEAASFAHTVESFTPSWARAVSLEVTVPAWTQPEDVVYILDGSRRFAMQPAGPHRWRLFLAAPLGTFRYTYARTVGNGYWGANDSAGPREFEIQAGTTPIVRDETVDGWERTPPTIFTPPLDADPGHDATFARGAGIADFWDPDMLPQTPPMMRRLKGDGVEWVNIKNWSWGDQGSGNPREQGPEYTRAELVRHIRQFRDAGFSVYLMPQGFGAAVPESGADDAWWDRWFAHYRQWILNFADIAAETGCEAFSPWSAQSLPPAFREINRGRWAALMAELRQVYPGLMVADGTVGKSWDSTIEFFWMADAIGLTDLVDVLFVDVGIRWAESVDEDPDVATLAARMETFWGQFEAYGRPIWIRLPTQSVEGVLWDPNVVNADLPGFPGPNWQIDEAVQARLFEAFFLARTPHPLITGLFTWGWGYNAMVDNGATLGGKAAEGVLRAHYLP